MDIIVGTAGHIDHGKTALVKALTGIDADRLPEEKKRGITIDLGFAELDLGETKIGFVDVPGHEKFVKNMLAGASGIDIVMLVIAADEGVMPQTREHFEICRLLETKRGLIVLTKKDLVESELLELAELDVSELVSGSFLENAPVVAVSSKTGEGVEQLKKILLETASGVTEREDRFITRLPIDRSFSVKGFGAVVTGTLVTGSIRTGEELEILPQGRKVRVRGLQTHGKKVDEAHAGQRTAVNLAGADHTEIERGMLLGETSVLEPTQIIDTEIEVLSEADRPLKTRQRVRVHIGTVEALARVDILNEERLIKQGGRDLAQLRLEHPVAAIPSERFIIRQYSPQITIAGGRILDAHAEKHKKKELQSVREHLQRLKDAADDPRAFTELTVAAAGIHGRSFHDLRSRTGLRRELLERAIDQAQAGGEIIRSGDRFVSAGPFGEFRSSILEAIKAHHSAEPLSPGLPRETLREKTAAHILPEIFRAALSSLEENGKVGTSNDTVRLSSHSRELEGEGKKALETLKGIYKNSGLQVPSLKDALAEASHGGSLKQPEARKIFQMLVDSGEVLKVSEELYFSRAAIEGLTEQLKDFAQNTAENRLIGVPEFKELAGITRKYAIPLLEYLDSAKVTRRAGDKRLIL